MKKLALVSILAVMLASAASAGVKTTPLLYHGVGTKALPGFTVVSGGSPLRWTSGRGIFSLVDLNWRQRPDIKNPQLIVSSARSGTSYLKTGRYVLRVTVSAGTRWTLRIG